MLSDGHELGVGEVLVGVWGPGSHCGPAGRSHRLHSTPCKAVLATHTTHCCPAPVRHPRGVVAQIQVPGGLLRCIECQKKSRKPKDRRMCEIRPWQPEASSGQVYREGVGEDGRVGGLPGLALVYLPRNQVLKPVQLVLVLRVVPGILFSEEGLGRTDRYLGFPVPSLWAQLSGSERGFHLRGTAARSQFLVGQGPIVTSAVCSPWRL